MEVGGTIGSAGVTGFGAATILAGVEVVFEAGVVGLVVATGLEVAALSRRGGVLLAVPLPTGSWGVDDVLGAVAGAAGTAEKRACKKKPAAPMIKTVPIAARIAEVRDVSMPGHFNRKLVKEL